jgi:DNA-binding NtrC family response regulator
MRSINPTRAEAAPPPAAAADGPEARVLIVDDNDDFCATLADMARHYRCQPFIARDLAAARQLVRSEAFDLIVLDLNLPDGNGIDLIEDIDLAENGQIAVITGQPTVETAIRAVRSPVVDYLVKPVEPEVFAQLFRHARTRASVRTRALELCGEMLGESAAMRKVFARIKRVAPLDVTVLMWGESGTGKELAARALHELSGRRGPFVAVNAGAVVADLLSSHLFGHERGAFTGAIGTHRGYFEQADGGTLFLDEVTEMPQQLQIHLLRVLETRHVTRVGSGKEIPVDVRVIAATNRDPERAVDAGKLRSDLYYRLLDFPLCLPPLRERREDIPLLAQSFLDRLNQRYGTRRRFAAGAIDRLLAEDWPGNVRELKHSIQRCYIMSEGDLVAPPARARQAARPDAGGALKFKLGASFAEIEREVLFKTLAHCNNNKRRAARMLGITAKTIYNRLAQYRQEGIAIAPELGDDDEESEAAADAD